MTATTVTPERLRELFHYSPETGQFIRKARPGYFGRNAAGSPVGWVEKRGGRVIVCVDRKYYFAHRLVWLYVTGGWPKDQIDHIDGDPTNNRLGNLRDVTNSVNRQNIRKAKKHNKLGILGVAARGKRYRANIKVDGKVTFLGSYATPEEAYSVYLEAKRRMHIGCTI